jgi:hypothetical protein
MAEVKRKKSSGGADIPGFKAWSFSRLGDWERCPKAAKYKHLDYLVVGSDKKSPALERGSRIHEEAEQYLNGELRTLPESLKYFKAEYADLRKKKAVAEQKWAFDAGLQPTEWRSPFTWLRMIVDAHVVNSRSARIVDLKTGKVRTSHHDQLTLYAMGAFSAFKGIKKVACELWYSDYGEIVASEYTVSDLPDLVEQWTERSAPMLADTKYPATPSKDACRWCDYAASRGGPCKSEYRDGGS